MLLDFFKRTPRPLPEPMASKKPPRFPVTPKQIAMQVHVFYVYVQDDPDLAPVLNSHIDDWLAHEKKLAAFWRKIILHDPGYDGHLQRTHAVLPEISPVLFERWLDVFEEAANEVLPPETARSWVSLAREIASGMQTGLAAKNHPCFTSTRLA